MFFDRLDQLPVIAKQTSCAIFVVPANTEIDLKHALTLQPDPSKKTTTIGVDQLRDFLNLTNNRETNDRFFVITPADAMNEAAQNAFLKTFEEPHAYCHFVLLTEHPGALLPTIRSRAQIFFLKKTNIIAEPPTADPKDLQCAKKLITAEVTDLPAIAIELSKVKNQPREHALRVTGLAIELLYKSYFKTKNPKFLAKLPNFLTLYDNLSQNGHIKLHLVADLL